MEAWEVEGLAGEVMVGVAVVGVGEGEGVLAQALQLLLQYLNLWL